ncbi:MAG TPA: ABC transporter permease [Candidatus Limnocylindria bacterium]|nr:ABC transporter permease [Candidatus Limnocylindria bacterium]
MARRLSVFGALFVASMKMFYRNRAAVFFSIFLPLVIMLIFGVLNFDRPPSIAVGVVDEARSEQSERLATALGEVTYLDLTAGARESELAALEGGERDFVLVIPTGWEGAQLGRPSGLLAFEGSVDPQAAQVDRGLLQQAVAGALAGAGGGGALSPPVEFESVESRDLGYIDFLVPGIVGMTVMQLGLFGVAFGFVQLKRTGALRRLFATPTSPAYFLAAQVGSRLVIGVVQVAILMGVGLWFGLQMFGDWASLAVIVLVGSSIFLAIGFAIAGWAKNEDQAAPVANLVSLPMMFLSGVFFPRDAMPELLRAVTQFMPLTYINEALRAVVNEGAGLMSLGPQLAGMAAWAAIAFVLAVLLFRWE